MKKKILSFFIILSLAATAVPVGISNAEEIIEETVIEEAGDDLVSVEEVVVEEEPQYAVLTEETEVVEEIPEETADEGLPADPKAETEIVLEEEFTYTPEQDTSAPAWDFFGLSSSGSLLKDGDGYVKWIDRLDLPAETKGRPLYNTLAEYSDNDDYLDYLIDDSAFGQQGRNVVISTDSKSGKTTVYNQITLYTAEYSNYSDASAHMNEIGANSSVFNKAARAAYDAFDRDHPEVFWLSGKTLTRASLSGSSSEGYTVKFSFVLRGEDKDTGEASFDVRNEDYRGDGVVKIAIGLRDGAVSEIMSAVEPEDTSVDKIKRFNKSLVDRNQYNTTTERDPATNEINFPFVSRECLNALIGKSGVEGPVCEGYSRAFKVLCDLAEIPCVLCDGQTSGGAHMWNFVEVENNWYAVDVTWNDSGSDYEKWMLVGANTKPDGTAFTSSHVMRNSPSTGGESFLNGPVLCDYSLKVYQEEVKHIVVSGYKTEYKRGDEIAITVKYYGGIGTVPETLNADKYTVFGDTSTSGPKDITVRYNDDADAEPVVFSIMVLYDPRISIEVKKKSPYYCGQVLDLDDVGITFYNKYNEPLTLPSSSIVSCPSESDMATPGKKAIVVRYTTEGKTYEAVVYINVVCDYSTVPTDLRKELISLDKCDIALISDKTYSGKAFTPTPKVTYTNPGTGKRTTLVNGTDYVLSYENNTDAGEATVTVTAIGNHYKGSKSRKFNIKRRQFGKLTFVASSVRMKDTAARPVMVYEGARLLCDGSETGSKAEYVYTVLPDVSKSGTTKCVLTATKDSNFEGSVTVKCACVDPGSKIMLDGNTNVTIKDYTDDKVEYDGAYKRPAVTVTTDNGSNGTVELVAGTDYSVKYSKNKSVGKAYITITGKKRCTGKIIKTFDITPPTAEFSVAINGGRSMTYSGKLLKPSVKVTVPKPTDGSKTIKLVKNRDYTVEYNGNLNAGTGYVTVRGMGNYAGIEKENLTFDISRRKITKASISKRSGGVFVLKYAGRGLKENADYTIAPTGKYNSKGKAEIAIQGIGNFSETAYRYINP